MNSNNNLRILRNSKGLTQVQLCNELKSINCNIDRSTYAKYENGSRQLPVDILIKLSVYFETSTDYILCLTENQTNK